MNSKNYTSKPTIPGLSEESRKRAGLVKFLHQDTTMAKSLLLKEKILVERQTLEIKQKNLMEQTKVRNVAIAQRTIHERWNQLKREKAEMFLSLKQKEEEAAVTIQRHVRGFLLRIKVEDDFIDMIDKKAESLIKFSTTQSLNIMLNLGVVLIPATLQIQKAFRRYQLRKKLYHLKSLYHKYQKQKLDQAAHFLKLGVRVLFNSSKLQNLRFLRYRKSKLIEIKENLAILIIKNYWRSRKFSFRIIRDKLLRLKRRQAAMQNKEAFAKYLSSIGGKLEKKPTIKLNLETEEEKKSDQDKVEEKLENMQEEQEEGLMDDEEFIEAQRLQDLIRKKIKDKVDKGKLSHGIQNSKQVMVLPLMQEKALRESNSGEGSKILTSTLSVFAKGRNLNRQIRKPVRSTLVCSPASCEHKKNFSGQQLARFRALFTPEPEVRRPSPTKSIDYAEFMVPTFTFNRKKHRASKTEIKKRDFEYLPVSSSLVVPTIAYSLKQQAKRKFDKKKNWSFRSNDEKYVPSVCNTSYSPVPWKPVPLNRNILGCTEYGTSFYREKVKVASFVSDFRKRVLTPELLEIGREDFSTGMRTFNNSDDF